MFMHHVPDPGTITMFSTTWCGDCIRLKAQLALHSITFKELNIEDVPGAGELASSLSDGSHRVPIVLYSDGSAATNPPIADVLAKLGLSEQGESVPGFPAQPV